MSKIANELLNIINIYIRKYNKLIDDEFGINQSELLTLWEQVVNSNTDEVLIPTAKTKTTKTKTTKTTPKTKPPKTKPPKTTKTTPTTTKRCPYIFTKGAKQGQECGCKPKGGKTYCSRHKKYEGTIPNVKKGLPPPRRSIVCSKRKATVTKKVQDIVLHKGPGGRLYHRPTGLVFNNDKVVIGTWLKACDNPKEVDEVVALTDKDVEKAKQHMFAFKREEVDHVTAAMRKVTRILEPSVAKKLEDSLSDAIAETNSKAEDVNDILCELQIRGSTNDLTSEDISDESEYEEELEEELEEEA